MIYPQLPYAITVVASCSNSGPQGGASVTVRVAVMETRGQQRAARGTPGHLRGSHSAHVSKFFNQSPVSDCFNSGRMTNFPHIRWQSFAERWVCIHHEVGINWTFCHNLNLCTTSIHASKCFNVATTATPRHPWLLKMLLGDAVNIS